MTPRPRIWRCVWDMLTEPRNVTVITTALYLWAVGTGVHVLATPSIDGIRDWIAGFLIAGGLLAATGCPFGHWWIERVGLIGLVTAVSMRGAIVVSYDRPDQGIALWMLGAALALLITRWIRIRTLPRDPRRRPVSVDRWLTPRGHL